MYRELIQIGPFTIYSYGFMIAVAFLLCLLLIRKDAPRYGITPEKITDILLWVLLGGIAGGRLLFVAVNHVFYFQHPVKILALRDGGMAIHGSLAGGILAGMIVAARKKTPFLTAADLVAPYIALGQSIGRIGCFLNGCCYGRILERGFGVTFPHEEFMRVPVQIYSSVGLLLIFIALLFIRGRRFFTGCVILSYFMIYSAFRFFMDFARGDNPAFYMGLTLAQVISAAVFVLAAGLLMCQYQRSGIGSR